MSKYIIDVGDAYTKHICGKGDMLCLPVRINEFEDNWLNTNIPLTPYTEPDFEQVRKEAYDKGYSKGFTNAKVQCNIQAEKDLREVGERHYQKGLSDAWKAARKIAISEESGGLTCREMQRIFCTDETDEIFDMSASEAIERIHQYEQEQEEQIQVGDEVKDDKDDIGICTEISYPANSMHIMYADGTATDVSLTGVTKTGRHFPEIAEVLEKMRGEQDG